MMDLGTYIKNVQVQSERQYGRSRSATGPAVDVSIAVRKASESMELYDWVDVISAATEAALRSGNTPFALLQAMMNRQKQLAAMKIPPPLAHLPPPDIVPASPPVSAPDHAQAIPMTGGVDAHDEYGPEVT